MTQRAGMAACAAILAAGWIGSGVGAALGGPLADTAQSVADGLARLPACRGGGVAVALLGRIETAEAFAGTVTLGTDPPLAPDAHSIFEIGSITKTFTALLFADALAKGLVKAEDPVGKYLPPEVSVPSFFEKGRAVPIRLIDLATHTSGLPRVAGTPRYPYGTAQMYADLAKVTLNRRPGSKWEYSNLGFALLAEAMSRAFKLPFEQLLAQHLGAALDLAETGLVGNGDAGLVAGLGPNGQKGPVQNNTWPAFAGAGAGRSTLADMARYLDFVMNGTGPAGLEAARRRLFEWQSFPRVDGPASIEQGLGWQRVMPFGNAVDVVWKDGEVPGFSAMIAFSPKLGQGVVVLASRNSCDTQRAALCLLKAGGEETGVKATRGPNCKF